MSYKTIALMAQDEDLKQRIHAAVAEQGGSFHEVEFAPGGGLWKIAASPGWGAAYDSALAGNVERPSWNEGVITDGMILSAVQAYLAQQP